MEIKSEPHMTTYENQMHNQAMTPAVPAQPAEKAPRRDIARSSNPMDIAPGDFKKAIDRRSQNRKALIEWVRSSLVDGTDYGAIQRRNGSMTKPSLRKPGAEKICGMLGVTPTFPTLKDYEQAALDGREIKLIILRCHILSADGMTVADGVGARSVEQDFGDFNKALKMALKSAHIDATLRMAGLSEIFTQDIEDMPQGSFDQQNEPPPPSYDEPPRGQQQTQAPPRHQQPHQQQDTRLATERQVNLIRIKLDQAGIPENEFLEKFNIASLAALPFTKVNPALHWISGIAG